MYIYIYTLSSAYTYVYSLPYVTFMLALKRAVWIIYIKLLFLHFAIAVFFWKRKAIAGERFKARWRVGLFKRRRRRRQVTVSLIFWKRKGVDGEGRVLRFWLRRCNQGFPLLGRPVPGALLLTHTLSVDCYSMNESAFPYCVYISII